MRVYKDIISGDEMVSDSYPNTLVFEDAALEVKSRLISKKANDDFGIGCKWHSIFSTFCMINQYHYAI